MTVYITTFVDGENGNKTYSIGAFSSLQKALDAFDYFMSGYHLALVDRFDSSILTTRTYIDKEDTDITYHFEIRKALVDTII